MYKIQANASGTRSIEVSDAHLEAIRKYALFKDLIDSSGFVDELALEKLKLNARSILESQSGDKSLLDLCLDVIYNSYMKVFGLRGLYALYNEWEQSHPETE